MEDKQSLLSANGSVLSATQRATAIFAFVLAFALDFTLVNVITAIVAFYLYSIIGVCLTLHRYYSHGSFEFKHAWVKWLCTAIAILSIRGSPLGWSYIHRLHHRYADTESDPHNPRILGEKMFGFKFAESDLKKLVLVKNLMTREQLAIHNWYFAIVIGMLSVVSAIGYDALYFGWILPVTMVHFSQGCFNYFAHMHGYRNFNTKDMSTNNPYLWLMILGDAWHNNHHNDPSAFNTQVKQWELDPLNVLVKFIRK